jgi:ATP-binding cassette, subfamily B, bacterial MsbA
MLKNFLRVIQFAKPYYGYSFGFLVFSIFSTIFGILNLGLLIPLLNVLFNNVSDEALKKMLVISEFKLEGKYLWELFNYYFALTALKYGKFYTLMYVSFIILGSVALTNFCYYMTMMMYEGIKNNVVRNLRQAYFDKILNLHIGFFASQQKGDLIARGMSDVAEIEGTIIRILDVFFRHPVAIILYFIALFRISVSLTLFTILVIPVAGGMIALISSRLRKEANVTQNIIGSMNTILDETLTSIKVIKSYNATEYTHNRYKNFLKNFTESLFTSARIREIASPLSEVMGVCVVVAILLYGGNLVLNNQSALSASAFITYIIIFSQVLSPAKGFSVSFTNLQRGISAADRIFEILDLPEEIKNVPNAKKMQEFNNKIEFRNVSFSYKENAPVLENISFEIKKGQMVALVGNSGGGKSTIADLLSRFYDVNEGEIIIDGTNIKELDLKSLHDHISIVTQKPLLFNDSVFNNIAFGQTNATQEDVENAAKIANSHDFIMEKEGNYQMNIGDSGIMLSGGQGQRLSIARAIFKGADILVLDEFTSALDPKAEQMIQKDMDILMKDRTTLVIAHRLSTIQNADLIIVLDRGIIVERGTHNELIKIENGVYKKMVDIQQLNR